MAGPAQGQATIEWRRLAADKHISIDVAGKLWEQAKAAAADPVKRSELFRKLIDEAAKSPTAAPEPGKQTLVDAKQDPAAAAAAGPGKTTQVLLDKDQKPGAAKPADDKKDAAAPAQAPAPSGKDAAAAKDAAATAPGADAEKKDEDPAAKPTAAQIRTELAAAATGKDITAMLANADPAALMSALGQLRDGDPALLHKVLTVAGGAIEARIGKKFPDPTQAKTDGPIGIKVPVEGGDGAQMLSISDAGVPMINAVSVAQKVGEWRAEILKRPPAEQEAANPILARASALEQKTGEQAKKTKLGDEATKTALPDTEKQLASALGSSAKLIEVKKDPAADPKAAAPKADAAPPKADAAAPKGDAAGAQGAGPAAAPGAPGAEEKKPEAAKPDPKVLAQIKAPFEFSAGNHSHSVYANDAGALTIASSPMTYPQLVARVNTVATSKLPPAQAATLKQSLEFGHPLYEAAQKVVTQTLAAASPDPSAVPAGPAPVLALKDRPEIKALAGAVRDVFNLVASFKLSLDDVGFRPVKGEHAWGVYVDAARQLWSQLPLEELKAAAQTIGVGTKENPIQVPASGMMGLSAQLTQSPALGHGQEHFIQPVADRPDLLVAEGPQSGGKPGTKFKSLLTRSPDAPPGSGETYGQHVAAFEQAMGPNGRLVSDQQLAAGLIYFSRTRQLPAYIPKELEQQFVTFAVLIQAREGANEVNRADGAAGPSFTPMHPGVILELVLVGQMSFRAAFLEADTRWAATIPATKGEPDEKGRSYPNKDGAAQAQKEGSTERGVPGEAPVFKPANKPDGTPKTRSPHRAEYLRHELESMKAWFELKCNGAPLDTIIFESREGAVEFVAMHLKGYQLKPAPPDVADTPAPAPSTPPPPPAQPPPSVANAAQTPPPAAQVAAPPKQEAPPQQPTTPQRPVAAIPIPSSIKMTPEVPPVVSAAVPDPAKEDPAKQPVSAPTTTEGKEPVLQTNADPVVVDASMAGAPHKLEAKDGQLYKHSISGLAVEKLQSIQEIVPKELRQKAGVALSKAVQAAATAADPALKIGAKPSDRPAVLQRLGAQLNDLAASLRTFGDSGNITDADPGVVKKALLEEERKAKEKEQAKKAAESAAAAAAGPSAPAPSAPPPAAPGASAAAPAALPAGPLPVAGAPEAPKKAEDGTQKTPNPGVPKEEGKDPSQGFAQANDARSDAQTAAGAPAKAEFGGKKKEDGTQQTVAEAAKDLHGDIKRDSHFNPVDKVNFERAVAGALLARAPLYSAQVEMVSHRIVDYMEKRKKESLKMGLEAAHKKYEADLAQLMTDSKPGWWGAVDIAGHEDDKALLKDMTLHTLREGTLPQKLAVHQNMYGILAKDFTGHQLEITRRILGVAADAPWFIRQQTKLKNGALDKQGGAPVFKPHDLNKNDQEAVKAAKKLEEERGRIDRPEQKAASPAAPGIDARDEHGNAPPEPVQGAPADAQMVYRGIDAFTMNEAKDFCQRARLVLNMPLAAGVSGSTAELIGVANTLGLSLSDQQKYAIAVIAYVGGGGNHSYHEIAVVLAAAGLIGTPDNYSGIQTLVGEPLFGELKKAHKGAFPEEADAPKADAPKAPGAA